MRSLRITARKIRQVSWHEFTAVLKRRSAQIVIFGLPLIMILGAALIDLAGRAYTTPLPLPSSGDNGDVDTGTDIPQLGEGLTRGGFNPSDLLSDFILEERDTTIPIGVVDLSGHLQEYPEFFSDARLIPLATQQAAYTAFRAGEIRGYYLIPASFPELDVGEMITIYTSRWEMVTSHQRSLYELILLNFIDDEAVRTRLLFPTAQLELVDLTRPDATEDMTARYLSDATLVFFISMLFYLTVMGAAGYLLQGLAEEKHSRVLEILLSSLRPGELLLGKLLGLGAIGLVQIGIWSLLWFLLFNRRAFVDQVPLPDLPLLTWGLIVAHFLIGYLVYGSMYASLGAIVRSPKESSQYTFLVALPVLIPLMLLGAITGAPNSQVAIWLSLIPLTSPLTMPMRLVVTAVPTWQWLLSLGISLGTAVLTLWLATRLFRNRILLSEKGVWAFIWRK